MDKPTPYLMKLRGLQVKNAGTKTTRPWALSLDEFHIDYGEIIFMLGARGAGKSAFHDAIAAIGAAFGAGLLEGENVVIQQPKPDRPPIRISRLCRAAEFRFHSQSGRPDHVPNAGEPVLIFCDDPNEGGPTGPAIIDLVIQRKHAMLIGTDPDRLEVTLRHFLQRDAGRIFWLHNGEKLFDGTCRDFRRARRAACESVPPPKSSSEEKFLEAVRIA